MCGIKMCVCEGIELIHLTVAVNLCVCVCVCVCVLGWVGLADSYTQIKAKIFLEHLCTILEQTWTASY